MTSPESALSDLAARLAGTDATLSTSLREILTAALQELIEAELTAVIGAASGERTPQRTARASSELEDRTRGRNRARQLHMTSLWGCTSQHQNVAVCGTTGVREADPLRLRADAASMHHYSSLRWTALRPSISGSLSGRSSGGSWAAPSEGRVHSRNLPGLHRLDRRRRHGPHAGEGCREPGSHEGRIGRSWRSGGAHRRTTVGAGSLRSARPSAIRWG